MKLQLQDSSSLEYSIVILGGVKLRHLDHVPNLKLVVEYLQQWKMLLTLCGPEGNLRT